MNLTHNGPKRPVPFKVGDEYRRLSDGRTFRVDFVNPRGINCAVFSATPTDGKWEHDGGPVPQPESITICSDIRHVPPPAELGHSRNVQRAGPIVYTSPRHVKGQPPFRYTT